jgi:hypothetical protein
MISIDSMEKTPITFNVPVYLEKERALEEVKL